MTSEFFNYLSGQNNCSISEVSSFKKNGLPENLLTPDRKLLWLSDIGLPHHITFDLTDLRARPATFKTFGFDCWHDLGSNPATLELHVSPNNDNFVAWTAFTAKQQAGIQLFETDPIPHCYNFIKIVITSTFGENRTYSNQFFLFKESLAEIDSKSQQGDVKNGLPNENFVNFSGRPTDTQ